jgi:tetratricopeptide (TPR) repeat protein
MMRKRLLTAGTVAALAAAVLLLGGVFREEAAAPEAAPASDATVTRLASGFAAGDTVGLMHWLEAQVSARPRDVRALALLGLTFQQRARETADPAYLSRSDTALRRAYAIAPGDSMVNEGLAALALSRHQFQGALVIGRRARSLSPTSARPLGLVGDALVELGRYRAAFAAFDTMAARKPNLASYARVSHGRELLGDVPGALEAMGLALDAATGQPEALAWTHVQLGKLHWNQGRLAAAAHEYRAALHAFPRYIYALDALAQVRGAQGRLAEAIRLEGAAVETIPLPQFVAQLGDLYRVAGRPQRAQEQYATIGVIERLLRANGVRIDLETALFDADHGRASLPLARRAAHDRPSIDGDDVLAWTLARKGQCGEALTWSARALRLGTQDALKFFHRAWIENCLGKRGDARSWARRALALNPRFSLLWAPAARRLAR